MLLYRRQHLIANSFSIRREKGERVGNTVSRLEIQFQTGQVTPMTDERWAVPQQGSGPPFRCRPFCWPMPFPNTYLSLTFSPLLSTRTGACWRLFAWIRGFFQIRTFSLSLLSPHHDNCVLSEGGFGIHLTRDEIFSGCFFFCGSWDATKGDGGYCNWKWFWSVAKLRKFILMEKFTKFPR